MYTSRISSRIFLIVALFLIACLGSLIGITANVQAAANQGGVQQVTLNPGGGLAYTWFLGLYALICGSVMIAIGIDTKSKK